MPNLRVITLKDLYNRYKGNVYIKPIKLETLSDL